MWVNRCWFSNHYFQGGYGFMKGTKSPKLALLLTCLISGLGHAYLGQFGKALLFFILWPLVLPWVFAIINAWESAEKINQEIASAPAK
jgi:TM2 domain-containing membrane protein YozV